MIPYLLAIAGGYLIGDATKDKQLFAKGGGVKSKGYSNKFVELGDGFEEKYFVRKFGNAGYDNKEIELLAIANIRDMESYVPSEELTDGQYHLNITLVPSEKYLSKKLKNEANDESSSVSDNTLINVVNYMGGLNYKPNDKYAFDSFEDAEEYLMSKELNDKISAEGMMSGFILDRNYNRAGDTNWDILEYMIGKKDKMFAKGGGVKSSGDDIEIARVNLKFSGNKGLHPYWYAKKDGRFFISVKDAYSNETDFRSDVEHLIKTGERRGNANEIEKKKFNTIDAETLAWIKGKNNIDGKTIKI
jgi:hypothetical protein